MTLIFLLASLACPSTEYIEMNIMSNCTNVDSHMMRLIEAFDELRSANEIRSEIGLRLQDFREVLVHELGKVAQSSRCAPGIRD